MSLVEFRESPWKKAHDAYEQSVFNIRPAPEFATAEVVMAATYRASGFAHRPERDVPRAGRRFDKAASKASTKSGPTRVSPETWRTILHGAIESPKQPNQSAKRFLQLCPVVPDAALYSGSARLSGNSWSPGELIKRMIRLGSKTAGDAEGLWLRLHRALTVDETDDAWARWLQGEFERRRSSEDHDSWKPSPLGVGTTLPDDEKVGLRAPATQFVRDLAAILDAKSVMTRRQWVSLLEAILRIGSVTHVLWLCDVNDRLWRTVRHILDGAIAPTAAEVLASVVAGRDQYLMYGAPAIPIMRDLASRYLVSRLGINLVLWHLEQDAHAVHAMSSVADITKLLKVVEVNRDQLLQGGVLVHLNEVQDAQARTVACKKGIGSNLVEFCRHTLGQRQTGDQSLRGYDQGYQLRKRAEYTSAPWIVSLGPVALLALVHCCLVEVAGPRSVRRLCEHMAQYGLSVDPDTVQRSDLGKKLRMLGLVLDSPDAESGMLLMPPFEMRAPRTGGTGA